MGLDAHGNLPKNRTAEPQWITLAGIMNILLLLRNRMNFLLEFVSYLFFSIVNFKETFILNPIPKDQLK